MKKKVLRERRIYEIIKKDRQTLEKLFETGELTFEDVIEDNRKKLHTIEVTLACAYPKRVKQEGKKKKEDK